VVELDCRPESGAWQRPDLGAGGILRFAMAMIDGEQAVAGDDDVTGEGGVRLEILDRPPPGDSIPEDELELGRFASSRRCRADSLECRQPLFEDVSSTRLTG
jgi:hypothetical protein